MSEKKTAKRQSFLQGAAILAAAVGIVKLIGFIAKIPLVNLLGGTGLGYYNIAYSVYNVLLTIATTGVPVAVSKLVAEANTKGNPFEARKILRTALLVFLLVGAIGALGMFIFAKPLAELMGSTGSAMTIRAIAPSVFCMSIIAVLRGYYQGSQNMFPTAISQIIEALGKLALGVGTAWMLVRMEAPPELIAAGAVLGMTAGEVIAMLYMLLRRVIDKRREKGLTGQARSSGELTKVLFSIAIPITLGSSVLALTNFIDTMFIMNRLQDAVGFTMERAEWLYGSYVLAQTMFNFPSAFIVPLAVSIVPAITAAAVRKDADGQRRTMETAIRVTSLLALPAAAGLSVLAGPILNLIWGAARPEEVAAATIPLRLLAIAVFFNCVVVLTNAILQSLGKVRVPVYTMLAGSVVKIVANYSLVAIPSLNINGAPIGTNLCYMTIMVLNLIVIARTVTQAPNLVRIFARPLGATLMMAATAWASYGLLSRVISGRLVTLAAIAIAGAIYLIMVLLLRCITRDELAMFPKGEKIAALLRIK